jgi:hypothetical protein
VSAGLGRTSRQREPEPGITVLEAGQQQLCPSVQSVGPRYSEWLSRVLDALLPACESEVRALADDHDAIITDGRVFPSTFPRGTGCVYDRDRAAPGVDAVDGGEGGEGAGVTEAVTPTERTHSKRWNATPQVSQASPSGDPPSAPSVG